MERGGRGEWSKVRGSRLLSQRGVPDYSLRGGFFHGVQGVIKGMKEAIGVQRGGFLIGAEKEKKEN